MHSAKELTSDSFSLTVAGRPASLDDVFPDFEERDRLGVVIRRPGGALGASALILAAVTRFYDYQRAKGWDFFIYPDFFLFHVGNSHGDHGMLDIWPRHKEVIVPDDPEELLRAINDRGVTRLLIEDGQPGAPQLERYTRQSAEARVRTALTYAPRGRVQAGDVRVAGNHVTESYVEAVLERSPEIAADTRAEIHASRASLQEDGVAVESYRRIALSMALDLLSPAAS